MLRNKKGDASSIITFMVVVFFLAVSFLVVVFANDKIKDAIETTQLNGTDVASSAADQIDTIGTQTVQQSFVVIVAFLIIGMMVSAFMVRVHPIFLFIYIFILAVAIFIGVPLANTYEELMNTAALSSIAADQTMTNWIMENFVYVILGAGALSLIVLFGKLRSPPTSSGGGSDF